MDFAHSEQVCEFTSEIFHLMIICPNLGQGRTILRKKKDKIRLTYSKNSRIIRHLRRLRLGLVLLVLSYADILDIATPENDVFIDTGGWRDLLGRVTPSTFRPERGDILKSYCGSFGIDLM